MLRNLNRTWGTGRVLGTPRSGTLAANIPSAGTSGAGYLYNDAQEPTYAGKELCGRITAWPVAGTLRADENSAFTFTGAPDGVYTATYELTVDGVVSGTGTVVFEVGVSSYTLTGDNCSQANSSGTGAVTVTVSDINLTGANCSQSNVSGTGAIVQGVLTLTPDDITAIANAVWAHQSAVGVAVKLAEAWGRLGLDPSRPLVSGQTSVTFGEIAMALTEGGGNVTVTRQP